MKVLEKKKRKKRAPRKKRELTVKEESFNADPRRQTFAAAFYDPTSETYAQLVPSGLKAGFTKTYSQNLTNVKPMWLLKIMEKMDLIDSVKRNIKKHLDLKTSTTKINKKTNEIEIKEDAKLLKIQGDMTMFVAEKLVDEYKKVDKNIPPGAVNVEIKQIIILAPNATEQQPIDNSSNSETISSVSTPQ